MADALVDNQTAPTTPASSKTVWWVDSTGKRFLVTDDGGIHRGIIAHNNSTAAQGAITAATDTYITGSGLRIPSYGMQVGMTFIWYISAVKTGAGVAAPVWTFRVGSAQTTADTSRLALTATGIQVATAFDAILSPTLVCHIASAVGTIAGSGGSAPNFGGGGTGTSSTFDNTATIAGQFLGISVNTGASAAWTITACSGFAII